MVSSAVESSAVVSSAIVSSAIVSSTIEVWCAPAPTLTTSMTGSEDGLPLGGLTNSTMQHCEYVFDPRHTSRAGWLCAQKAALTFG